MRKIYQTEWHGIALEPLMKPGEMLTGTPGRDFYAAYYRAFFHDHASADSMAPEWRRLKGSVAAELSRRWIPSPNSRVLSIGCGIGVIEGDLWRRGFHNLDVTEICEEALPWLRKDLPASRIYVGSFPDCLPADAQYDLIYFCTIDYVFDTSELIQFLGMVRLKLKPGGKALLLAHGLLSGNIFLRRYLALRDRISEWKQKYLKTCRGLFWGYLRSREEYAEAFRKAGFSDSQDGILPTGTQWINYFRSGIIPSADSRVELGPR